MGLMSTGQKARLRGIAETRFVLLPQKEGFAGPVEHPYPDRQANKRAAKTQGYADPKEAKIPADE